MAVSSFDRHRRRGNGSTVVVGGIVFVATFALATYALTPRAPGKAAVAQFAEQRMTDQHFSGCDAARAAGRENIPAFDPSYRERMDGDGDGLACEPYRSH